MDNKLPIMVLAAGWSIAPILIPRVFGGAVDAPVSATAPVILNHSILSVGGNPGEADVSAFISSIPLKEHATAEETAFGLEAHVSANPQSPWAASLHNVLGMEFRREGRFTCALDHWQAAWDATKDAVDGNGKLIADETLANWVQLQASLGRFEDLTAIFDQTRGRYFEYGPHAQLYLTTLEAYRTMIWDPGQAYRCGTLALQNVAVALGQGGQLKDALFAKESPASGFALSDLVQFANDLNIGVTAVDRGNDTTIVVPSVVHWRQNHYAAIVKQRGSAYLVVDPTFGPSQWRPAEVINEEASGIFLVPRAQAPPGWRRLDLAEASRIHGRGLPTNITDTDDQRPCVSSAEQDGDCHGDCPAGTFPPGKVSLGVGPSSWGPGQSCPTCGSPGNGPLGEGNQVLPAMTGWRVSEPFESLWLEDDPIAYSPGRGPRIRLRLSYKQRDTVSLDAGVFNFGPQWNVNWLSYIEDYLSPGSDPTTNMVTLHVAGGGTSHYTVDNSTLDFLSASRMEWLTNSDGTTMAFKLHYRSGAMDIYGWLKTNVMGTNVSYASRAFLSQKIDVQGNAITFNYKASVTNTAPILVSVVDADGRSTTLNYTNTSFPNQVTSVVDPFGRTSTFSYDSSGQLQSITDPDGIVSSYTYDSNHWITNLVTPYGTTQFILTSTTNALDQATNTINRAVEVIQPDGGHHLFALRSSSDFLPDTYDDANNVPSNIPIGSLDIFCCMNYRNTFYWSPRQFANLSTTNKASFSTNDYNRAWLRHWLHDGFLIGPVLSMEREPSVASGGTNYGKMTWFDYDGKAAHGGYANQEGTTPLVGAAVKVLPDGSTWYKWFQRDQFQNITNEISTYSSVGSVATRTNSYVYDANGIDLIQVIAADGTLISSNLFTSAHLVATNFDGLGQATIFQYDASGRVTDITYPSGLETQLSYYTGSGTNLDNLGYVKQVVDVGFRTNTFGYSNGLISTHTNELSLVRNFSWDRLKRLTNVAYPDGSSMAIRYDWSDRPLDVSATKDRNGNWTYFDYTPLRQLSVVTNALSKKTEFSYCSCGSLTSVTLPLGAAIGYTYDNEGQLTSSFVSGWNVKNSYFYNAIGQRSADYVGDGVDTNIFAYTYNNQGLVTSITNTVGQIRAIAYDVLDRPTNIVDAAGTSATLTYDALGRITSAAVAGSGTNSFYYTARGLTNWVDGLGRTNWCVYDAAGRKVADTNANGEVRQFQFNPSGQITQLTDGKGNVTAWAYDVYGRLTTKTDATNNAVTYAYYPTGWLSNRVDALGQSVKYNYDAVGNLTSIAYPSRTTSFAYDAMNRLSGMSNGVGVTTWDYTGYHALLDEGGLWANDTVGYWYDTDYTREQLTIDAPNATPWLQTYLQSDLLGRKPYFTSPLGTFTYGFNGTSLLVTNLGLASGSTITNGYDAVARLTGTWFQNSAGTVLNSHTYGYDLANERSTLTNNGAQYWQYVYDAIGQLNKASGFEAGGTARLH